MIEKPSFTVNDDKGRTLTMRRPGVLRQLRLVEILGNTASNEIYMGMVLPTLYLTQIDGVEVFPVNTKAELEALVQRLDDEGLVALSKGVSENFAQAASSQESKELAKK